MEADTLPQLKLGHRTILTRILPITSFLFFLTKLGKSQKS